MNINEFTTMITSVGFPIVACLCLFYFNKVEIEKLRETLGENTKVLNHLADIIKMLDRRGSDAD